jgi:hypothetical protein
MLTDSNGLARLFVDSKQANQPGELRVDVDGFKVYVQNIDIVEGSLPDTVQLEPLEPTIQSSVQPSITETPPAIPLPSSTSLPTSATRSVDSTSTPQPVSGSPALLEPTKIPTITLAPTTSPETFSNDELIGEWNTSWKKNGRLEPLIIIIDKLKVGEASGTLGYVYTSGEQCRIDINYVGIENDFRVFNGTFGRGRSVQGRKIEHCINSGDISYRIGKENGNFTLEQYDKGNRFSTTIMERNNNYSTSIANLPAKELIGEWQTTWLKDGKVEPIYIIIQDMEIGNFSGTIGYLYKENTQCRIDILFSGVYMDSYVFFGDMGSGLSIQGNNIPSCGNSKEIHYKMSIDTNGLILKQYVGALEQEFAKNILERVK